MERAYELLTYELGALVGRSAVQQAKIEELQVENEILKKKIAELAKEATDVPKSD